jgi:hypothetical protein
VPRRRKVKKIALLALIGPVFGTLSPVRAAESASQSIQAAQTAYAGGDFAGAATHLNEALQQLRVDFARQAVPERLPGFQGGTTEVVPMRVPGFMEGGAPLPVKATRTYTRDDGKDGAVELELIVGRAAQRDNPFLRFLQQKNMIKGEGATGETQVDFGSGKASIKTLADSGAIQIDADAGKMGSVKLSCTGCKDQAEAQQLLKGLNPTLLAQAF